MTPILYESTETLFVSNGLGRLNDCIACKVTEERNGIYEIEFDYPVNGRNYDKITLGRIVAVTHDDTGDIQPFDIVSCSRPINGVVTFRGVHISYRLNKITIAVNSRYGISSWDDMVSLFNLGAMPTISPFEFFSDTDYEGTLMVFDGTPRTIRQILGGVEGSVLDTWGGEFEFNKFNVTLHRARGEKKNFAIRYGLNLADYEEEIDFTNVFNKCMPYWKGNDSFKLGDVVDSGAPPYNGIDNCVPLDLSEKFEKEPTKAKLNNAAKSYMASNKTYQPSQNIKVDFIRLQDSDEYAEFESLLSCKLCDSITVIFPQYGTQGDFKIVKTVWDVLKGRYSEMELGDLEVTLSQALGITQQNSKGVELIRERHTVIATGSVTVNGGGNNESTATVTKEGYYPLGVVGHAFGGTNRAGMNAGTKLRIISVDNGTCDVDWYISNTGASAWSGAFYVDILWRRI